MTGQEIVAKEHPIIFSGPAVQAILDGRKTMTRRVVKAPKWGDAEHAGVDYPCPYGQPGDRLWVREAWSVSANGPIYKTDRDGTVRIAWKPSIHTPRWASRITLEITAVRVERVQDITARDVEAEGIDVVSKLPVFLCSPKKPTREKLGGLADTIARGLYQPLWDSLNAKRGYGWNSNPWVWVISFKRVSGEA